MKQLIKQIVVRAIWTFCETFMGMLIIGQAFYEIEWLHIASVSGVAAVISILKSIVFGLPEATGVEVDKDE